MIIFDKCGMTKFFIIRKEKVAYMEKMDKVMEGVLEYLKHKGKLTELENDILLATQICQSSPFDSEAAKKKIMEFNAKYRELCSSILVTPGIKSKPLFDMKDEEVWESLWIQVEALCGRELGEIERGWMKEKNKDNVENYTCKQNDGWGRMEERRKRDIKDRL